MATRMGLVKDLKTGKYVVIDGIPCRVVEIQKSKPGKHGSAKARVTAIGIFDGQKKQLLKPVDANIEIPDVRRRNGQVVADLGNTVQIMDLESYETFEVRKGEIKVSPGQEVEYTDCMGHKQITRVKG
ncbi:MAG: translation initiation factor IF-5A [Candidatus Diapherotrites archaeon]|nr:translation initiation factor IF-5A [Candidatus Diapherotrites archaeon]